MTALNIEIEPRKRGAVAHTHAKRGSRHRTIRLALSGRFMRSDRTEHPAKLIEMSVAHMTFSTQTPLTPGERLIAYVDQLGGLEGEVTEVSTGRFSMCLNITTRKREKLAAQLTWLINRHELDGLEERQHKRYEVTNKSITMRADETLVECRLLDISLSGASLGTNVKPAIGTKVLVGRQRAIVRRHHEEGIGVQFLRVQEAEDLQSLLD